MILAQRLISLILITWLAVTLAFFALRVLPGDAIQAQLVQSGVSRAIIEQQRAEQGLLDPPLIQYVRFMVGLLRGDMGFSLLSREPVSSMILRNLLPTATLAIGALVIAIILGISLGTVAALSRWLSSMAQFITSLSLSAPIYYTGTLAIAIFSVRLGLLPSAGAESFSHLILPVSILGFHSAGAIARVTRANIRNAIHAEFVRTARAKGISEKHVVLRHILRVSLLPVIQVIALQAGFLLSGAVITESLFVRPGIGRLLLEATIQQDYPVVQGVIILSAITYTLFNTFADILHGLLDPRIAYL
jgi:peptide/nickel transport system permease protein